MPSGRVFSGREAVQDYATTTLSGMSDTHFEDLEINLDEIDFAPSAPPIYTSDFISSSSYGFLSVLPGCFNFPK